MTFRNRTKCKKCGEVLETTKQLLRHESMTGHHVFVTISGGHGAVPRWTQKDRKRGKEHAGK
jgi:hypothetical protein